MSSNPTGPDHTNGHYSVDEMIDRLKKNGHRRRPSGQHADGELVTRADGSQVIKVRKHKRRTKQPRKKNNSRTKWILIAWGFGVLVLALATTIFIIAKYNGRSFKQKTESTISSLTGAENVELSKIRVTPLSARASGISLQWAEQSFFHSATFSDINANILATSFLSPNWFGEEVVATEGQMQLQEPKLNASATGAVIDSPYSFESYRCNKFDVIFGAGEHAPSIRGTQASLRRGTDQCYQVVFSGGEIQIPRWLKLPVSSGILILNSNATKIEAKLGTNNNHHGNIIITGSSPKTTHQPLRLAAHATNYPIQELIGEDLGRFIEGNIESKTGTFSYHYHSTPEQAVSFSMPFHSTELQLRELPMLSDLRDLTKEGRIIRPIFNHCEGTINRSHDRITLSNLHLAGNTLITLKGSITVDDKGLLTGQLNAGIPIRLLRNRYPEAARLPEVKNGYLFIDVTLGGSIHNPHDDLHDQLQRRLPQANSLPLIPLEENHHNKKQKEKEFKELTR